MAAPAQTDPLHALTIAGLQSLQERNARAAVLRKLTALAALPAPLAPARIHDIIKFANALHRLMNQDRRWYFAAPEPAAGAEFARDMQVLHTAAGRALDELVTRCGEWTGSDDDPKLQQLVGFALYHLGAAIKWGFLRREVLRAGAWPPLHALYRFAEQAGFATYPLRLFDEAGGRPTTLQAIYLRALLLDVLNTGSLSPAQIEIADGWLEDWTMEYALDMQYVPDVHTLLVDLGGAAGMQIAGATGESAASRYLRVDALKAQLDNMRGELRAGRAFPSRAAPALFPIEEQAGLLDIVERVYQTLLQASAAKIEQRTRVADLRAEVRLGFAAARTVIASEAALPGASAAAADAPAPMQFGGIKLTLEPMPGANDAGPAAREGGASEAARWRVHDMSSRGVGLLVNQVQAERIAVGELIAVKPDGFAHWMLGAVVRKIGQQADHNTLLGIEIFCYRPLAVLLTRFAHAGDAEPDPTLAPIGALYLPGRNNDGTGDILLLPAGDFALKTTFSLATRVARFRVRINRVLRKGGDWIGLRFEVIARKDWPAADSRSHR